MRVLIIEDYDPLRKSIAKGLREAGFAVDAAADGEEGLAFAESAEYDVIILDLMLPKVDGLSVLRRIRGARNLAHVLVLTAKDKLSDRVDGLNLGADDYLVKPFAFEELVARVSALVRRKYGTKSPTLSIGDLIIDTAAKTVTRAGSAIDLTAHEYSILELLAVKSGHVVTRSMMFERLYDCDAEASSNVIEVYIANLRRKLDRTDSPKLIHTRRGLGYVLREPE
jgi:DNA-binding response OmpR family regulator